MITARRFLGTFSILAATVAVSGGLFAFALPAHAVSISVIPPKFELYGNPGDVIQESIKVRNNDTTDVTYQADAVNFQARDDTGGVDLIDDPNAPHTTYALADWVTIEPAKFTVPANTEKAINFTIHIPKTAEPGGHYASIQVKLAGSTPVAGGASVENNLNTLVLLRVSGDITEKDTVESFATSKGYYQSGPIDFTLKTHNDGNVHVAPAGVITITDIFGHKVDEIPINSANVLPGSSRSIKTTWDKGALFGRYTAQLVATYGQNHQPLTSTVTFTVFPLYLLWIVLIVIFLIILAITQRKKLKRILHSLTSD
jgi:hypothetical protein